MSYQLWHGDRVDETGLYCPVCFDLIYENFDSHQWKINSLRNKFNKASPHDVSKGTTLGFDLSWRARRDFKHRAEEYNCEFCAALLQIVDIFWRGPTDNIPLHRGARVFCVTIRKDASVELRDMRGFQDFTPMRLLLYTPSGYEPVWGRLPPSPAISPSGNSKSAYSFLKAQLDTCVQEHENCRREPSLLPTRVLDLGNIRSDIVQPIKIIETHIGTLGKYIALSYCWGDGNRYTTTRSNISKLLQEVDEEELPATIRDAIEIARYLGVQFLWVDALCIIQDDTEDWIHESAQMAAVYGQAFLTIAASSVASSRMSFLHASRVNGENLFRLDNSQHHADCHGSNEASARPGVLGVRRTTRSGFHQDPARAIVDPGMCRAWMLQEYLLSLRVISYSADEVQWICRTMRACECGNPEELDTPRLETLQQKIKKVQGKEEDIQPGGNYDMADFDLMLYCHRFWNDIVKAYCRRELSWARDKLPALSGIAREYAQTLDEGKYSDITPTRPSRYLAGLWEDDIHSELFWINGNDRRDCVAAEYCAPSWSWASLKGAVFTFGRTPSTNRLILQTEILEAVCALADPDNPFGQVLREGTYLRVRGSVVETKMRLKQKSSSWDVEYQTPYGFVAIDCGVETVVLGDHIASKLHGATAAANANTDNTEGSDLEPVKTVRRRHDQTVTGVDDGLERIGSSGESDSESDSESDAGSKKSVRPKWKSWPRWEVDNLGEHFTVWLLHLMDRYEGEYLERAILVLGRPEGESQEVYERIGIMRMSESQDDTASNLVQWPEKDENLIRTITIV